MALPRRGQRKFQPFCPRADVHWFILSRWHFAYGIKLSNCEVTRLSSRHALLVPRDRRLILSAMYDDDWVKKCMEYEVEGPKPRGRPKRTWREVVREDCQARKLNKEDAVDRCKWRKMIKDAR